MTKNQTDDKETQPVDEHLETSTSLLLLRLMTGEDIIGMCESISRSGVDYVLVTDAKVITQKTNGQRLMVVLQPWVMPELVESKTYALFPHSVLAIIEPSELLKGSYTELLRQEEKTSLLRQEMEAINIGTEDPESKLKSYVYQQILEGLEAPPKEDLN